MVNVEWLRYFVALDETPNFAAAADKLHISPQTMSNAIAGLERHYGQILVQRDHRMKGFTPAGEALLAEARAILASLDDTDRLMAGFQQDEPHGPLRIAGTTILNSEILPHVLATLVSRYPAVLPKLYVMRSADIENRVAAGDVDLGVFMRHPSHDDVAAQAVAEARFVIVGRPQPTRPWYEWPFIVPRAFGDDRNGKKPCASEQCLIDAWPDRDRPRLLAAESDQYETTIGLAEAGVGVAFIPEVLARRRLEQGRLAIVAESPVEHVEPVTIVWRKGVRRTAAARAFCELLQAQLQPGR